MRLLAYLMPIKKRDFFIQAGMTVIGFRIPFCVGEIYTTLLMWLLISCLDTVFYPDLRNLCQLHKYSVAKFYSILFF
jgi:hypothetical protein